MRVTYSRNKISWCILKTLHGSMNAMDDGTVYFDRAVSYMHKMFMKLTTDWRLL
jgi:hypothetical protein